MTSSEATKKGHLACMNIKGRCQLPKKAVLLVLLTYSRVCISIKSLDSIPSKFANWQTSEFPKDMIAPQLRLLGPKQVGKRDFYLLFWSAMYFRLVHYTLSSEEKRLFFFCCVATGKPKTHSFRAQRPFSHSCVTGQISGSISLFGEIRCCPHSLASLMRT